jgi:hypothetical protein
VWESRGVISLAIVIGFALGFSVGKVSAARRMQKWLRSLASEDALYVRELLHPEDRWKQNAEHDARMSSQ